MRRDYRGRTQGNETEIVDGDLAEIESCDAVLAAFTSPDEGTAIEAWHAHTLGKRVEVDNLKTCPCCAIVASPRMDIQEPSATGCGR